MSSKCIFCEIVNRTQKADILYEDEEILIFSDIKPAASFHVLVIPKVHIKDARSLKPENLELVEKLVEAGNRLLTELCENVDDTVSGFHWPPFNSISHLHLHVINRGSEMSFWSRTIFKPNSWWFTTAKYVLDKLKKEAQCHL